MNFTFLIIFSISQMFRFAQHDKGEILSKLGEESSLNIHLMSWSHRMDKCE